jgi:NAD(P)-dependent dehydrogenase (short-subunit alcohol dehydrogenase family)
MTGGVTLAELNNKVALVTGGGGGLGAAICRVLSQAGASVVIADLNREAAENLRVELQDQGGQAMALQLDVGDEHQVAQGLKYIVDEFGRLDILINNAGTDITLSITELEIKDWDQIIRTNLRGPFVISKLALPELQKRGGHIFNVASTASKRAWANASAYHASKWGLLGFSHALHVEARALGVKVTAMIVGGMRTPFLLDRFPDIDPNVLQDPQNVAATMRYVLNLPAETVIPEIMVLPMHETSWP